MTYVYDGTLEGFLSAVFDIYVHKATPQEIISNRSAFQPAFDTQYHHVETTKEKAARLMAGMEKIGAELPGRVVYAFLSWMPGREMLIYRYIAMGFDIGDKLFLKLADDTVRKVLDMERQTGVEKNKTKGFLRFSVTENNIFYAEMSPKNNILPLIMAHFCRRFRVKPFIIRDLTYSQLGMFDTQGWYIHEEIASATPHFHTEEAKYRYMWKLFYDITSMDGRENGKNFTQRVPLRYQKHMTELQAQPYTTEEKYDMQLSNIITYTGQ
jgi:probable DNA metabolism protein